MPVTHVNPDLPDDLPEFVLSYAPPAPPRGGGRPDRRLGRPTWGIGAIATDPNAWIGRTPRARLVRAATLTSVMGVAWAGPQVVSSPPPSPDEVAATIDEAVTEDLDSTPVAFQRGNEGGGSEGVRAAGTGTEAAPQPASASGEQGDAWRSNVIARWGDVEIVQPSPHVKMVGFHEGGSRADDVRPAARPHRDLGKEPVEADRRKDDLPSMILPGRGRGTGAATAIDIAMPEDRKVHAPITGKVTAVNGYALYGSHADTIITIQPDGHPEVMMEILHVTDPTIEVGDRVVAGKTVIAESANLLPFSSQIDRFAKLGGAAMPHVHVEMQRLD